METPRFYCPDLNPGDIQLDPAQSRHALGSLRLRAGDRATLFDGRGRVARGTMADSPRPQGSRASAIVTVETVERLPATARRLVLIVAGCKGPRLSWLVEKCTELGADEFIFTNFERSVVRVGDGHVGKLRRTAIEACKQCGRDWLPKLRSGLSLEDAVTAVKQARLLIAHPDDSGRSVFDTIRSHKSVAAVIGPEGGLTPDEIDRLLSAGGLIVNLARHVLRVETAAAAMAAQWSACESASNPSL